MDLAWNQLDAGGHEAAYALAHVLQISESRLNVEPQVLGDSGGWVLGDSQLEKKAVFFVGLVFEFEKHDIFCG